MPEGRCVFRMTLTLARSPPMNTYSNLRGWKRASLRKAISALIVEARQAWPAADMGVKRTVTARIVKGKIRKKTTVTGGRRRLLRVTRCSARAQDEDETLTVDVCGGKLVCDRLVIAGILRGDNRRWLARQARWQYAAPGEGLLLVEVFELDH